MINDLKKWVVSFIVLEWLLYNFALLAVLIVVEDGFGQVETRIWLIMALASGIGALSSWRLVRTKFKSM